MRPRPDPSPVDQAAPGISQVACLLFRDFFVDVERSLDGTLARRPVAIGHPRRPALVSCEIDACGLGPGASAERLRDCCPEVAILPGRIEPYLDAAALADEALWRLGLRRAWHGFTECLFEPESAAPGAGGLRRLAERAMTAAASAAGVAASCGLADTVVAARAAASLAAPRGLLQVLPGYDACFLSPLAVGHLEGIDRELAHRLERQGLSRIGLLASCQPDALRHALGRAARPLVDLAGARDPRRVGGRLAPARLVRAATVDARSSSASSLREQARTLADDLAHVLTESGWEAGAVTLRRYGLGDAAVDHRTALVGGALPVALVDTVAALVTEPAGVPVSRITVVVSKLRPAGGGRRALRGMRPATRAVVAAAERRAG